MRRKVIRACLLQAAVRGFFTRQRICIALQRAMQRCPDAAVEASSTDAETLVESCTLSAEAFMPEVHMLSNQVVIDDLMASPSSSSGSWHAYELRRKC